MILGIVIGAGIFRSPSIVAGNSESGVSFLSYWIAGGVISLIGALCYAELTTAFPDTGGDYHFLTRAFGKRFAFLFAWARLSVIQTGSIALLSYIFGDYVSQVYNLGEYSSVIYAFTIVILLTGINILGIRLGTGTQKLLTAVEVSGTLMIIIAGLFFAPATQAPESTVSSGSGYSSGLAMVFVLLTFGGWNEAAYITAELRSGHRSMVKVLVSAISIITVIYVLINIAYLKVLGLGGMAQSNAVAGDLMSVTFGSKAVYLIGALIAVSSLTSANATIFTGARTNYALGKDFRIFSPLGKWNSEVSAPVNALLVQGLISLGLVGLGLVTRKGFETIVEYTAPVFWFFFLMTGIALFVLRGRKPEAANPFRVPLYPLTPVIFCLSSAYLLYSSLVYTGLGALVGVGVLALGFILLLFLSDEVNGN